MGSLHTGHLIEWRLAIRCKAPSHRYVPEVSPLLMVRFTVTGPTANSALHQDNEAQAADATGPLISIGLGDVQLKQE